MKIALNKSQSHCQQLIDEIKNDSQIARRLPNDMLTLRVGGDITLEEKLLLKQFKELEKFSLSPTSGDGTNRRIAPRSAKSLRSEAKTKVYDSKPRAFIEFIMELNLDKDQLGDELEKYLAKQEQHFQNAIGNIKR